MEVWYRYEDVQYAPPLDEYDEPCGEGELRVALRELPVLRHTPKGVWLTTMWGAPRFVRADATKRYACPTKEQAKESFIARKKRQAGIYEARASRALRAIAIVEGAFL